MQCNWIYFNLFAIQMKLIIVLSDTEHIRCTIFLTKVHKRNKGNYIICANSPLFIPSTYWRQWFLCTADIFSFSPVTHLIAFRVTTCLCFAPTNFTVFMLEKTLAQSSFERITYREKYNWSFRVRMTHSLLIRYDLKSLHFPPMFYAVL